MAHSGKTVHCFECLTIIPEGQRGCPVCDEPTFFGPRELWGPLPTIKEK